MKTLAVIALTTLVIGQVYKPNDKLAWDPVTTDINGNPEIVVSAEAAAFPIGGSTPVAVESGLDPAGAGWVMAPLVDQLPEGTYDFAVRVIDAAGNVSEFSNRVQRRIDRTQPATPGGCRIFR